MRAKADAIPEKYGIDAYVTGTTALNIDTADTLAAALPKYIAVVLGLALLLLMVVFRSVLVPLKAAAGFLLSIAAAMGATVWIFQDGNLADLFGVAQAGPIVSFLPVLLIGILFGLAMDYEVFLVSRMREAYVKSGNARESVVTGYGQSGRVVTAAAVIMTAVFAAFLLDPDPVVKSIGLSLAIGVLADAFVVRMTLVPAVMALLGRQRMEAPAPARADRARGGHRGRGAHGAAAALPGARLDVDRLKRQPGDRGNVHESSPARPSRTEPGRSPAPAHPRAAASTAVGDETRWRR